MKTNSFVRIDGLGIGTLRSCAACRTLMEPILGIILTVGLYATLVFR